ncbi:uncharacterized protein [Battus philenor]|uniref:uncharacterized protein n=1 Tax=Battus philenor TaxID=42288 RepID=UPI0035CFAB9C
MLLIILLINLILKVSNASESVQDTSTVEEKNHTIANSPYITHLISVAPQNRTYLEKPENLLRMPKKYYEDRKRKRKTIKKLPKRTVQKIIKKTKSKYRRNFNLATMQPTKVSNIEKSYPANVDSEATTQMNQRKKSKKNLKLMRYPMPFQKLPFHYRYRRDNERDVYILKDLDEIEFLSKEDGEDIVRAHVQKYW